MKTPREVIHHWTAKITSDAARFGTLGATFKFIVQGEGGGTWFLQCRDPVHVLEDDREASCTVTVSSQDFVRLGTGAMNPQVAYMMGKLRVSGDKALALKLHKLI
jgi:putative sterol carrier protein